MDNSQFPKVLFATLLDLPSRETENIDASRTLENAVDAFDETNVAEYQLVTVRKYRKQVVDISQPARKVK